MAKSTKKEGLDINAAKARPANYEPSELVIKEMMIQKGCTREEAIEILKNPSN